MLKIKNLTKIFNKGSVNEKVALRDISMTVGEGEFVTVIGGNGAGKSTLLNCISGVFQIDEGKIYLDQSNISKTPEYKRSAFIGRVFQDPLMGTAFDMTIEENLAIAYSRGKTRGLTLGITKVESALFRERLALLNLGLENRIKEKVGRLSGGQRQALTLLMATIVKPKLLLLDEHTAALDPSIAAKVLRMTDEVVKENNLCTLMITHNMKAALEHGTRTIMMHDGRIMMDIQGSEREGVTVDWLIDQFSRKSGTTLDSDRMLLG